MTNGSDFEALTKSMRRMKALIGILCAFVVAQMALTLGLLFKVSFGAPWGPVSASSFEPDPYNGFSDWPVDRQIASASVILLLKEKVEGNRVHAVIQEILKQKPGTEFYFKVGDEYPEMNRPLVKDEMVMEGEVAFLAGPRAEMRFAESYRDDVIGGNLPIRVLRDKINATTGPR